MVYELNSPETTTWLRKEKDTFMVNFGRTSMVKVKSVAMLIEYVPISHSPDALAENRRIEHDSKIEVDTLLAMRWIKPVHRRAPGQHTVHIIARFKTATASNLAIWDGVIIASKRVWAKWLHKEPRRCLKCQILNTRHLAADCTQVNRCGTCGGEHRTVECVEEGHASTFV